MSKLLARFDDLMSHLNAEENDLAATFKAKLALHIVKHNRLIKRDEELSALEAGGVDNWSGYSDCFEYDEEEDDE